MKLKDNIIITSKCEEKTTTNLNGNGIPWGKGEIIA